MTQDIQIYTGEEEANQKRMDMLAKFNPKEHLVQINTKQGGLKPYYPAAWRLYELNLRYTNANFSSEIILLDVERNLVVVKCRLYLGASYEASEKKTEALKSGPLSTLDKVETAAKARCARDFGISTELALDIEEEESGEVPSSLARSEVARESSQLALDLGAIMAQVKSLGLASNKAEWSTWKRSVLGEEVTNAKLSAAHIAKLCTALEQAAA